MGAIEQMQALRDAGWLIVLKAMPKGHSYTIEGGASEYDAPCKDKKVGKGQWSCEAHPMIKGIYRTPWALGDTADEALDKVAAECSKIVADAEAKKALLNQPITFGLRAQGHLPMIEKMLTEGASWEEIGKAINWEPATAKEFYERERKG